VTTDAASHDETPDRELIGQTNRASLTRRPPRSFQEIELTALNAFLGVFLLILAAFGRQHARARGLRTKQWTASVVILLAAGCGYFAGSALDTPERAIRHAQSLVDAILRDQSERNGPPEKLYDLVPQYLSEVPHGFTRTFEWANYDRDKKYPLGWWLTISGSPEWRLSSVWLNYEPEASTAPHTDRFEDRGDSRRIGAWVWNQAGF
jgi:hypothetical protein